MDKQLALQIAFWTAIAFTVLGGAIGVAGIWIDSLFKDTDTGIPIGWRMVYTDALVVITCVIVCMMLQWLGGMK